LVQNLLFFERCIENVSFMALARMAASNFRKIIYPEKNKIKVAMHGILKIQSDLQNKG